MNEIICKFNSVSNALGRIDDSVKKAQCICDELDYSFFNHRDQEKLTEEDQGLILYGYSEYGLKNDMVLDYLREAASTIKKLTATVDNRLNAVGED